MQGVINRGFNEAAATHPARSRAPMRTVRSGSSAHDEPYNATPRPAAFTEGYTRTPNGHHQHVHQHAAATEPRAHVACRHMNTRGHGGWHGESASAEIQSTAFCSGWLKLAMTAFTSASRSGAAMLVSRVKRRV